MSFRHLFAVDPGDVNNGFCYFKYDTETKTADTKIMRIFDEDGLDDMLKTVWGIGQVKYTDDPAKHEPPAIYFVVENFRIDGHVRQKVFQWSEAVTIRQIGKVKLVARWMDASFILQEPKDVWPMARKWAPASLKVPQSSKVHVPDDKSAWCHGAKFMRKRNWINTVDQITFFGQERLV